MSRFFLTVLCFANWVTSPHWSEYQFSLFPRDLTAALMWSFDFLWRLTDRLRFHTPSNPSLVKRWTAFTCSSIFEHHTRPAVKAVIFLPVKNCMSLCGTVNSLETTGQCVTGLVFGALCYWLFTAVSDTLGLACNHLWLPAGARCL